MSVSREVVLGVRLVELAIRHAAALIGFGIAGALVAAGFTLADDRPYVTRATVEIGVRHIKEPLENPLVAAERLSGFVAARAAKSDPQASVAVEARRDPTSRALMRYLDLTVSAKTSSAAETIAKLGLADFIAAHKKLYDYERGLIEKERSYHEAWATLLEAALGTPSTPEHPEGTGLPELATGLFETQRQINGLSAMLSDLRTPPTRILESPSAPAQVASRVPRLALGGFLAGLVLAVAVLALRGLASKSAIEEHHADRAPEDLQVARK